MRPPKNPDAGNTASEQNKRPSLLRQQEGRPERIGSCIHILLKSIRFAAEPLVCKWYMHIGE